MILLNFIVVIEVNCKFKIKDPSKVLCFFHNFLKFSILERESPSQMPSSQTQGQQLTMVELTDRNLAWQHLLRTEEVTNCENSVSMLDIYNIEWAKKKTVKTGLTFKMPMLAAAIKSVDLTTGLDPV